MEKFIQYSQIFVCVVSFAVSYHFQSFKTCILLQLAWALILAAFTLFGCPWLKTNELKWLPAEVPEEYRIEEEQETKKKA